MSTLSFEEFEKAVRTAVGISFQVDLQPAGGFSQKVYPPTYPKPKKDKATKSDPEYATEKRRIDNQLVDAVLLDSIPSQANRLELALDLIAPSLKLPVLAIENLPEITSLTAPHRIVDAYFIDSLVNNEPFPTSEFGKNIIESTPRNATHLFRYAPTALLFGMWASQKALNSRDGRFARALASEIVGWSEELMRGVKTASRIDPLNIVSSVPIYESKDPIERWTLTPPSPNETKPKVDKASKIGLGNVAPSINQMGGYTVTAVRQFAVLSFLGLRRWQFPLTHGRSNRDVNRDAAGYTVLAALGLIALFSQFESGYALRSGCDLQPLTNPIVTVLGRTAQDNQVIDLDLDTCKDWLELALSKASLVGLDWASPTELPTIQVSPKVLGLIQQSAQTVDESEDETEPGEE